MSGEAWPWIALGLLGALHGLNPGMGWLFAVALGMQQGERRAVWRALAPLTAGHALAIVAAVALSAGLGLVIPPRAVRWLVIVALALLGVRQLFRHAHPRVGGMRMRSRDLVTWSFLVASAHGAGLMAVPLAAEVGALVPPAEAHAASVAHATPVTAARQAVPVASAGHGRHGATTSAPSRGAVAATLVHTLGYVLVTGLLAVVVFERAGLGFLRRAWVNLDVLWAGSLLLTALFLALA